MLGFGAMFVAIETFDLKGGLSRARRFLERTRILRQAVIMGGIESLIVLQIYTFTTG